MFFPSFVCKSFFLLLLYRVFRGFARLTQREKIIRLIQPAWGCNPPAIMPRPIVGANRVRPFARAGRNKFFVKISIILYYILTSKSIYGNIISIGAGWEGRLYSDSEGGHFLHIGKWGERRAVKYLEASGFTVLESNFRCRIGEIDIVARESGDLVFAEVKTRADLLYGLPCEAVNERKQRQLARVAEAYLSMHPRFTQDETALRPRFDVIEILLFGGRAWIRHIRDAF
jgi:putative endonuclease